MPFYADLFSSEKRKRPLRADDKRVSLLHSLSGSMTVEAALAVPLYLFFLFNVIWLMEAVRKECILSAGLHETGMTLCEAAGLGKQAKELSGVEYDSGGEEGGDSLLFGGNDIIELHRDCRIQPFIPLVGPAAFTIEACFYGHAFTGYDVSLAAEEENVEEVMVYVTLHGSVYHRQRSCRYLNPAVRNVGAGEVDLLRNDSGGRYYPCELCHPQKEGTLVITTDGDRYHKPRPDGSPCPGLKRTVRTVPLSSVEGKMPACSRCGGE